MIKQIREARKSDQGFTLIELLMVIVILGILAGIVVFAVSGINDRGEVSACKAEVSTVGVAQEAYYAKNTGYAADLLALKTGGFLRDSNAKYVTTNNTGAVTLLASAPAGC